MQDRQSDNGRAARRRACVGRAAGLQQLLDQIDAAARAIALVAADDIGRAGRGAEAAMHAGAQDFLEPAVCGSASCSEEKWVCMRSPWRSDAGVHPSGIEEALRIEARLHALRQTRKRRMQRLEHIALRPQRLVGADQHRRGREPATRAAHTAVAASVVGSVASQTSPPPQSNNGRLRQSSDTR